MSAQPFTCAVREAFALEVLRHPPLQRRNTLSMSQVARLDVALARLRQLEQELNPVNDHLQLRQCAACRVSYTRFGKCAMCAHGPEGARPPMPAVEHDRFTKGRW